MIFHIHNNNYGNDHIDLQHHDIYADYHIDSYHDNILDDMMISMMMI